MEHLSLVSPPLPALPPHPELCWQQEGPASCLLLGAALRDKCPHSEVCSSLPTCSSSGRTPRSSLLTVVFSLTVPPWGPELLEG